MLAAGAGRRMGRPKGLVHDEKGRPWVSRAVEALAAGGCDPVTVVVGAAAMQVRALVPAGARVVEARDWAQGMGASLRAGLGSMTDADPGAAADPDAADATVATVAPDAVDTVDAVDAVVVMLVDTPGVGAPVVTRLLDHTRAAQRVPAVLARAAYAGHPGHPVVLGRDHWAGAAADARGDRGARTYLRDHEVALVECSDIGHGDDVDTRAP